MYEVFEKKATRVEFPAVSVTPGGKLALNAAAGRKFREEAAEYVLLLWDSVHRKIGIRVISKRDTRSFKVSYSRKYAAAISAASFLRFIGWRETKRVRFPAIWNDEQRMFEFSLGRRERKTSRGSRSNDLELLKELRGE
ncbi:MAG: hypothetical protein WBD87_06225 [Candidatus Acidiferrales bacterium]